MTVGPAGGDPLGRPRCHVTTWDQQHTAPNAPHLHLLPVKEHQIVEQLVPGLKDEVTKITPVQRTRFKAFDVVGEAMDTSGSASTLGRASQGARQEEVLGEQIGQPHTVPCKVTVKCGSVTVRMVPVPTGSGIVAACVPKKVLQFAGIEDVFTSSRGFTKTLGNFVKTTFDCLMKTYGFLTPEFCTETKYMKTPFLESTDLLAKPTKGLLIKAPTETVEA
ncbi:hypothetical protein BDA96_10G197100 [Sorghum bicolor]|uniref:Small ribosomal subunit protein uS5 C-terminal domain-containing protein n=2 Tax=Sorghum bicolor TaxID=4558 RepID=A0A921U195_SORBI|nr:hypothetical protein BDA96_10G197100 [Sorghum bicolor]OQU76471.1 hypothetical protein SORBI_3010G150575 [Sorghum bicolor]